MVTWFVKSWRVNIYACAKIIELRTWQFNHFLWRFNNVHSHARTKIVGTTVGVVCAITETVTIAQSSQNGYWAVVNSSRTTPSDSGSTVVPLKPEMHTQWQIIQEETKLINIYWRFEFVGKLRRRTWMSAKGP